MQDFFVKIGRQKIKIDRRVFIALLDFAPIEDLASYKNALRNNEINLIDLKDLAQRTDIPYPLFFAPKAKIDPQIKDYQKSIESKFVTKNEMQLGYRGFMKAGDIALLIRDMGRKQEFLKNRIFPSAADNIYIGSLVKQAKEGASKKQIADSIKKYFNIDLQYMRGLSKKSIIAYLCDKIENKNIFVSTSSYRYMPQEMDKKLRMSGFCIKDKKFPFIFINNRDGDEKPIILETEGRQIFTLVSMLVCIGMNKFILNSKRGKMKNPSFPFVYGITAELLVPREDITNMNIVSLEEIRELAKMFKVTPSVIVYRLAELRIITPKERNNYLSELRKDIEGVGGRPKRSPTPTTGYSKYNGVKFSRDIISAYSRNKITAEETKHILFRRGKIKSNLLQSYVEKFK